MDIAYVFSSKLMIFIEYIEQLRFGTLKLAFFSLGRIQESKSS